MVRGSPSVSGRKRSENLERVTVSLGLASVERERKTHAVNCKNTTAITVTPCCNARLRERSTRCVFAKTITPSAPARSTREDKPADLIDPFAVRLQFSGDYGCVLCET